MAGIDHPGHGQAIFRLEIIDAVAAHDGTGRLARHLRPAGEDLPEDLERLRPRPADDVERVERLSPHRVHVRNRVGRGDGPVVARVVDHRREKIEGRHQRPARVQLPHGRVVAGLGPDEKRVRTAGYR
jgi:hypothetical protein